MLSWVVHENSFITSKPDRKAGQVRQLQGHENVIYLTLENLLVYCEPDIT